MLKAAQRGPNGLVMLLGLSSANLERLRGGEAIQFHADEVELGTGIFVIAHDRDPQVPIYRAHVGSAARALVVLPDAALATLRRGELVEIDLLALGATERGSVMIFHGETEASMLEQLARHGIVTTDTRVRRPQRDDGFGLVPTLCAGLGAAASFYAAIVDHKGPLLVVIGLILLAFTIWGLWRMRR
ncbi:hypothetical protein [Sandaracinus amylolyticus]|uniref:hypothetical protein n=1 Tax=Sandaracinus amylolyticus TaxID=927083 RepID=UPI001F1E95CA|nr:hypothetical protein [Sandaracinus amylolyticus]UJR82554.1 Hypothetical protein I5071_46190 [Sandaracinus amylolyticus]